MFGSFIAEEKAQGSIEYILLAGGIIVAAVVVVAVYTNMAGSAIKTLNESTTGKVGEMGDAISNVVLE